MHACRIDGGCGGCRGGGSGGLSAKSRVPVELDTDQDESLASQLSRAMGVGKEARLHGEPLAPFCRPWVLKG